MVTGGGWVEELGEEEGGDDESEGGDLVCAGARGVVKAMSVI